MSAPVIHALLVDDEVLARLALRQALEAHPDVRIVGECGNANEAMQFIAVFKPDLMFLDIRLPGLDGFNLLRELEPNTLPMVVFATA
jgi:two-component system LytT family response regulator